MKKYTHYLRTFSQILGKLHYNQPLDKWCPYRIDFTKI